MACRRPRRDGPAPCGWSRPGPPGLIAFAKSSFILSPLPPTGGEGEGGRKKLLATSIGRGSHCFDSNDSWFQKQGNDRGTKSGTGIRWYSLIPGWPQPEGGHIGPPLQKINCLYDRSWISGCPGGILPAATVCRRPSPTPCPFTIRAGIFNLEQKEFGRITARRDKENRLAGSKSPA
jgi:hypothetical protein